MNDSDTSILGRTTSYMAPDALPVTCTPSPNLTPNGPFKTGPTK